MIKNTNLEDRSIYYKIKDNNYFSAFKAIHKAQADSDTKYISNIVSVH